MNEPQSGHPGTSEAVSAQNGSVMDSATPALATGAERRQLVDEWSGAGQQFSDEPSLAARFEAQAALTPNAVALSFENESLTYSELNARANQLAHFLRARGVGSESLVGLLLERSIEMLVGLLGIVKAGAAYLPMDVSYPPDRLAFMVKDARAVLVLSLESGIRTAELGDTPSIFLDADWSLIAQYPSSNPTADISAQNLAYVIYTSGSTGNPKGCEVTHGNVVRLFESSQAIFHFAATDVWTMFHSHAFDFSVWEIWGAWLYGGRLVVVPVAVARAPEKFLELLQREGVTFLNQTPSAFKSLAAVATEQERVPLTLRCVLFGGEALSTESLRGWIERFGDAHPQLFNGYGITETTVFVTYYQVRAIDLNGSGNALIGKPLADL
ncbi:MAG: AMP-binding protein, partial [Phycisphaerae bacterium]|nr:AMP-binding protein [Gemmatimonadaceae bacterium]